MSEVSKKLYRPRKGRKIAGVAAAFSEYFGIDVTIIRLIWVFLLIPGGFPGLLPYLVCWVVIPDERKV